MKTYKVDLSTSKLLKEMSDRWQIKEEALIKELIRESYNNSNGGKIKR